MAKMGRETTTEPAICRLKERGMSWYSWGAANLLRLRLLKLNKEWDDYWDQKRKLQLRWAT